MCELQSYLDCRLVLFLIKSKTTVFVSPYLIVDIFSI